MSVSPKKVRPAREVQETREAVCLAQKIRPAAKFKKHAKQCVPQISPKTTSALKRQDTCCSVTSIGQTLFEVRRLNHGFVKKILSIKPEEGADEQSMLNDLDELLRTVSHLHFRNPHVKLLLLRVCVPLWRRVAVPCVCASAETRDHSWPG